MIKREIIKKEKLKGRNRKGEKGKGRRRNYKTQEQDLVICSVTSCADSSRLQKAMPVCHSTARM
jgi:hypothetical protein